MSRMRHHSQRAFTLLELLVTMGIVLVIASLILFSLRSVMSSASDASSGQTLRQLLGAYTSYASDHNDALIPGYVSEARIDELRLQAKDETGRNLPQPGDSSPYLWRLAPYLQYNWSATMDDYDSRVVYETLVEEISNDIWGPASASAADLGPSSYTSFGLNSIFLGGDDVHTSVRGLAPWLQLYESIAATNQSQVRNPSRIVVFAPTERAVPPANPPFDDVIWGAPVVVPPYLERNGAGEWTTQEWALAADGTRLAPTATTSMNGNAGWPTSRRGTSIPVVSLDGSVTSHQYGTLATDMRLWWWKASTPREPLAP